MVQSSTVPLDRVEKQAYEILNDFLIKGSMILVGDRVFAAAEGENNANSEPEGWQILNDLLILPQLVNGVEAFKSIPPKTITFTEDPDYENFVYVFQKEFATACATHVKLIGTDESTTCIGVAIHNPKTCLTSVGHLDSKDDAALGLGQMVSSLIRHGDHDTFEVHLVGAYDDTKVLSTTMNEVAELSCTDNMKYLPKNTGYSWPLSLKVIEFLFKSPLQFLLKTLCILEHNTCIGQNQHCCPNVRGFVIETGNGHIMPARFLKAARAPDALVRQIRVSVVASQRDWRGGLIDTYITYMDKFVVSPFKWSYWWVKHAAEVLELSDSDLLAQCSTSPHAETEDFVESIRGSCHYVCKNPDWRQTFPKGQWRVFTRTTSGRWTFELMQGKSILNWSSGSSSME